MFLDDLIDGTQSGIDWAGILYFLAKAALKFTSVYCAHGWRSSGGGGEKNKNKNK